LKEDLREKFNLACEYYKKGFFHLTCGNTQQGLRYLKAGLLAMQEIREFITELLKNEEK